MRRRPGFARAFGTALIRPSATEQQLIDLLRECYPNLPGIAVPTINPRIKLKIEALLDEYRKAKDEPDPTWHAGTGPATRR
jgi:hypothetical protein